MPDQNSNQQPGRIVEIKGVVIDAVFPGQLPGIYNALSIQREGGESSLLAGRPFKLIVTLRNLSPRLGPPRRRRVPHQPNAPTARTRLAVARSPQPRKRQRGVTLTSLWAARS